MDKHLVHLIKQTERYTSLLADNLKYGGLMGMDESRIQTSRMGQVGNYRLNGKRVRRELAVPSDEYSNEELSSDDDYSANHDISEDDETTLIEEEMKCRDMTVEEELTLLRQESELNVDELRAKFANNESHTMDSEELADDSYDESEECSAEIELSEMEVDVDGESVEGKSDASDEDYVPVTNDEDGLDDETTLIEEEERSQDLAYEQELKLLRDEGEMSLDQLRAMYAGMESLSDESNNSYIDNIGDEEQVSSEGDENFELESSSEDDETTLVEEEARGRDTPVEEEIRQLKDESELSLDQLRAMYAGLDTMSNSEEYHTKSSFEPRSSSEDSDESFEIEQLSDDDETTLIEEESLARDVPVEEEINALRMESEIPIDELRAMYRNIPDEDDSEQESDDSTSSENNISPTTVTDKNSDSDEEFLIDDSMDLPDDETTMIEEEMRERDISVAEELRLLRDEGEMSIEELRAIYADIPDNTSEEDEDAEEEIVDASEDEFSVIETSTQCRVRISESSQSSHQSAISNESAESNNVDDALRRLESADLEARSVHVSVVILIF